MDSKVNPAELAECVAPLCEEDRRAVRRYSATIYRAIKVGECEPCAALARGEQHEQDTNPFEGKAAWIGGRGMTPTPTARARGPVGDWRHRAACRDVDPELFFPVAESGPLYAVQVAAAKAVCAGCPARAECLVFAVVALPDGVAGGLTPAERRDRGARPRAGGSGRATEGDGRPGGASRGEVAAAGRAAIRAGRAAREAARELGVSERTAERWATEVRDETSRHTGAEAGAEGRGAA